MPLNFLPHSARTYQAGPLHFFPMLSLSNLIISLSLCPPAPSLSNSTGAQWRQREGTRTNAHTDAHNEPRSATRCPSLITYLFVTYSSMPFLWSWPSESLPLWAVILQVMLDIIVSSSLRALWFIEKEHESGWRGGNIQKGIGQKAIATNFLPIFFLLPWIFPGLTVSAC